MPAQAGSAVRNRKAQPFSVLTRRRIDAHGGTHDDQRVQANVTDNPERWLSGRKQHFAKVP